jgi:glutathione S-transferase
MLSLAHRQRLPLQQQQQQQHRHQHRRRARPASSSSSSPPSPSSSRCRYAANADRFAECVLFTEPDPDGPALTPACQSVMMALLEKRVPFRHALVRPGAPDHDEFDDLYAAAVAAVAAAHQATHQAHHASPPLLADSGTIIAGTKQGGARVLLEYVAEKYRAAGTPLIPSNPAAAATMRLFCDVFLEGAVAPFYRFVRAGDGAAAARAKRELLEAWGRVDAFLLAHYGGTAAGFDALDEGAEQLFGSRRGFVVRPPAPLHRHEDPEQEEGEEGTMDGMPHHAFAASSDPVVDRGEDEREEEPPLVSPFASSSSAAAHHPHRPYLLGRSYSLAEVAATPYVARMAALLPELREFELVPELRAAGYGRAADWASACLQRPSAVATDPTADEMVGGLAAAEWARVM